VCVCGCDPALHSRRLFQHLRLTTSHHSNSLSQSTLMKHSARARPTTIFESNTSLCQRGANNPQDKLQRGYESGPGALQVKHRVANNLPSHPSPAVQRYRDRERGAIQSVFDTRALFAQPWNLHCIATTSKETLCS
jgi:hypothetical protein